MTRYRLYTERRHNLAKIVSFYFEGFTLYKTIGYWKGIKEHGAVIEIITDNWQKVKRLAEKIKTQNKQETVLITSQDIDAQLI